MQETQKKINELFSGKKTKTIIVRNFFNSFDTNFNYFSQLNPELFPGDFIALHPGKKPVLIASRFEAKNAKVPGLKIKSFEKEGQLLQILKKEMIGKKIGLNLSVYPVNSFKRLKKLFREKKFIDISPSLVRVRATKTRKEIKLIRNAVNISEESLGLFPEIIKKFKTEKAIAGQIDAAMKKNGADGVSFPTIVAGGANAAVIHHEPSKKKIKKGELVLIDFGAKANNYCSDLTRMFCLGTPSEKQENLFETVLGAKKFAEGMLKPKTRAKKIFEATEKFLNQKGFALEHGLGHGLGLETHDYPSGFTTKSKTILQENMVLTVEPGIYGKFGGIRLEDDILITKGGFKFLSKPQKELIRI